MARTLRQEIAHELFRANTYQEETAIPDRSARDVSRYRQMLELLELPLDTELVIAVLTDEQAEKLLGFLRLYNKPDKTRYDWIQLEALFEEPV